MGSPPAAARPARFRRSRPRHTSRCPRGRPFRNSRRAIFRTNGFSSEGTGRYRCGTWSVGVVRVRSSSAASRRAGGARRSRTACDRRTARSDRRRVRPGDSRRERPAGRSLVALISALTTCIVDDGSTLVSSSPTTQQQLALQLATRCRRSTTPRTAGRSASPSTARSTRSCPCGCRGSRRRRTADLVELGMEEQRRRARSVRRPSRRRCRRA